MSNRDVPGRSCTRSQYYIPGCCDATPKHAPGENNLIHAEGPQVYKCVYVGTQIRGPQSGHDEVLRCGMDKNNIGSRRGIFRRFLRWRPRSASAEPLQRRRTIRHRIRAPTRSSSFRMIASTLGKFTGQRASPARCTNIRLTNFPSRSAEALCA
jgi:hypothetical protein